MRNRHPRFLPSIWATAAVLGALCLLLAILEIVHLSSRIDRLAAGAANNRAEISANNTEIAALKQTIETLTSAIAAKDEQIISLGGTPSPVAGVSPRPRPSPARTVIRVVPGPTVTVTATPKPAPAPVPVPTSVPRLLPTPFPTLTSLPFQHR